MAVIRNKKLLDSSNGQSCVNCGVRDGTVVSAHLTGLRAQSFGKGTGIKASDLCTADLCMKCHSKFDSYQSERTNKDDVTHFMAKIDQSELFLYCVLKTIHRRVEEGLIKLP